jgi:tubulin monoglycylase TTLL3/8
VEKKMVHHTGTIIPLPKKDLDSSTMGDSDTTEDGEQVSHFSQTTPPESFSCGSH